MADKYIYVCGLLFIINTSYQKLPFGSGVDPDKLTICLYVHYYLPGI